MSHSDNALPKTRQKTAFVCMDVGTGGGRGALDFGRPVNPVKPWRAEYALHISPPTDFSDLPPSLVCIAFNNAPL